MSVRTDLRNAYCLCARCHRFYTDHPREFSRFITDTWAQPHYDSIFALARVPTKVDWELQLEYLKETQELLDEGRSVKEIREAEYETSTNS